ncbi:MAG: acetate kinase [Tidjanibacter sp.]|nr:acetate kinase [Tidjanibacter sp.]MBR6830957.1 acetate kinase [Tidjanibacter sp.]
MIILVLNCGSSSIKYQVIEMNDEQNSLLAKGLIEKIGFEKSIITHRPTGKDKAEFDNGIQDHTDGIDFIIKMITDPKIGVIKSLDELSAVGHRVAHGGEYFDKSTLITPDAIEKIESCKELAPLHVPANLKGIIAISKLLPEIPQVATFDTSFHLTMPAKAYMYGLPYKFYRENKIRRYGFHGTSHKFVAQKGAELAGIDFENSKIITCHVGSGGSIAAILNGKSVDTSMGFTPVEGIMMGTRSGDIDAGIINYMHGSLNMKMEEIWNVLNKESGVLGLSEVSSDMRDVSAAKDAGNKQAELAIDAYYYRVKKYVGAYAAAMGGVDLVVFTGGVGENKKDMRHAVCENMEWMGLDFDAEKNDTIMGEDAIITKPGSKVKAVVICTNEELVIATDTYNLVK